MKSEGVRKKAFQLSIVERFSSVCGRKTFCSLFFKYGYGHKTSVKKLLKTSNLKLTPQFYGVELEPSQQDII